MKYIGKNKNYYPDENGKIELNECPKGYFEFNKVFYIKEWLDLALISDDNPMIDIFFCVAENSLGKSYSVENKFCKVIMDGGSVAWIRNSETQVKGCVKGWIEALKRNGMIDDYEVTNYGIFKKNDIINKKLKQKPVCVCPFVYASSFDSSTPQIENVELIGWDEFIPGNEKRKFTICNPLAIIANFTKRVVRKFSYIKPKFFFISNPHDLEDDLTAAFRLSWDWDKLYAGEDDIGIRYGLKQNIAWLAFSDTSKWIYNDNLLAQAELFIDFRTNGERDYKYYPESCKRQILEPKDKEILFNYNWHSKKDSWSVYQFEKGLYVKRYNIENDAPWYAFKQSHMNGETMYIDNETGFMNVMSNVLSAKLTGKLYYDSLTTITYLDEALDIAERVFRRDKDDY